MKQVFKVRVVVPAFEASSTLPLCIQAVCEGSRKPDEVVVVDDGGNGELDTFSKTFSCMNLKSETPGSAARARNLGAQGFQGDILVFLDADVVVEIDALQKLLLPIEAGYSEASVGNYSSDIQGLTFAQAYKQLYIHHMYARKSGFIEREFWTALGAVRRDVFEKIGGFGGEFQGACAEDTDFGFRLSQSGFRIFAVPEAQGRHLNTFTLWSLLHNDFRKGVATVRASLEKRNALTNNRHASKRDILAVFVASTLCLTLFLGFFMPKIYPASILLGLLYAVLRADLLKRFLSPGLFFLVRASLVCFVLDLVRAVSVGVGVLLSRSTTRRTFQ